MKTRKGYSAYPLTVAQKFHNYYSQYCPGKEILNIGSSLTIEFQLNIEELRKAIYKAYERCESMRARLAYDKKEKEWYQYIVEREEREIPGQDHGGGRGGDDGLDKGPLRQGGCPHEQGGYH